MFINPTYSAPPSTVFNFSSSHGKHPSFRDTVKTALFGALFFSTNPCVITSLTASSLIGRAHAATDNLVPIGPFPVGTSVTGPLTALDCGEINSGNVGCAWIDGSALQRSVQTPFGIEIKAQEQIATIAEETNVKFQGLTNGNYLIIFAKNNKVVFQEYTSSHNAIGGLRDAFPSLSGTTQTDPDVTRLIDDTIVFSCTYDGFPIASGQTGLGIYFQKWSADITTASPTFKGTCLDDHLGIHYNGRIAYTNGGGVQCDFYAESFDAPYSRRINFVGNPYDVAIPVSDTIGNRDHPAVINYDGNLNGHVHAWAVKSPSTPSKISSYAFATFHENTAKLISDKTIVVLGPQIDWPRNSSLQYLQIVDDPQGGFAFITRENNKMTQHRYHSNATVASSALTLIDTPSSNLQACAYPINNGWGVTLINGTQIIGISFIYDATFSPTPVPTVPQPPSPNPTFEPTPLPTPNPNSGPSALSTPTPPSPTSVPSIETTSSTSTSDTNTSPSPPPTPAPNTNEKTSSQQRKSSKIGEILGAFFAACCGLATLVAAIVFYFKERKKQSQTTERLGTTIRDLLGRGAPAHVAWDNPENAPKSSERKRPSNYDLIPIDTGRGFVRSDYQDADEVRRSKSKTTPTYEQPGDPLGGQKTINYEQLRPDVKYSKLPAFPDQPGTYDSLPPLDRPAKLSRKKKSQNPSTPTPSAPSM